MEKIEFVGNWWLPEKVDQKVGGILTVEPSGRVHLQLTSALLPDDWSRPETDTLVPDILHGTAGQEFFTLMHPHVTGTIYPLAEDYAQKVRGGAVIRGAHLSSVDQPIFTGATLAMDNLTAWSQITGMTTSTCFGEAGREIITHEIRQPARAVPTGKLDGLDISLVWQSTSNYKTIENYSERHLQAHESIHANITSSGPQSWQSYLSTAKSLQDLLTFATRHPCAIRPCYLLSTEPTRAVTSIQLYRPELVEPQDDERTYPHRYLFNAGQFDFATLLSGWDELRKQVGLGVHALFGLDYNPSGYLETKILSAASAAESIQRALNPDHKGLSSPSYDADREKIKNALAESENLAWFLGRLKNDPGFKERMQSLASMADEEAVLALLTNVDQWATHLKNARNALAHLEGDDFDKIPDNVRELLEPITTALLHLVFLAQLGASPEIQLNAVKAVYYGIADEFRTAVSPSETGPTT